jgi:hypothetical protein
MGCFSWNCSGCGQPVLSGEVRWGDFDKYAQVVLLRQDGGKTQGKYSGYGSICDSDSYEDEVTDEAYSDGGLRWYHQGCYQGQTYAETKPAGSDVGQGYFYEGSDLELLFNQGGSQQDTKIAQSWRQAFQGR